MERSAIVLGPELRAELAVEGLAGLTDLYVGWGPDEGGLLQSCCLGKFVDSEVNLEQSSLYGSTMYATMFERCGMQLEDTLVQHL